MLAPLLGIFVRLCIVSPKLASAAGKPKPQALFQHHNEAGLSEQESLS